MISLAETLHSESRHLSFFSSFTYNPSIVVHSTVVYSQCLASSWTGETALPPLRSCNRSPASPSPPVSVPHFHKQDHANTPNVLSQTLGLCVYGNLRLSPSPPCLLRLAPTLVVPPPTCRAHRELPPPRNLRRAQQHSTASRHGADTGGRFN